MRTKATVSVDEHVMRRVKERAAREGRTMSDLVEEALRDWLDEGRTTAEKLVKIRRFNMGPFPVDISDRNALHDFLDQHD